MPIAYKSCKCGAKIARNVKCCEKCEASRQKIYDKTTRNQESKAFYNSKEWWRVRTIVLRDNQFCVNCNRPADVVDHIKELIDGGAPLALENLQPLCHACHNKKTAEERGRR